MLDRLFLNEMAQYDDLTDCFSKYKCIIIDECHERNINTDVLLGFIKQATLKNTKNNEFRIIITSATMDEQLFK